MVGEPQSIAQKGVRAIVRGKPQPEMAKVRARQRHINFEHINFLKVGTTLGKPAGEPEGKVCISCVSRRTHKLLGPVNPGTTSRLSRGRLDVNQSKKT